MSRNNSNRSNRSGKNSVLLKVLCGVLAFVLVLMVGVTVYAEYLFGKIGKFDEDDTTLSREELDALLQQNNEEIDPDATYETIDPADVTTAPPVDQQIGGEEHNIVNILLMGQDDGQGASRSRTDSLILCTFNLEKKTLTMTSFMRDMYVEIPNFGSNRINVAYPWGGLEALDATLMHNFGIHVDGHVAIDFSHFQDLIDLLGGVDIELSSLEANHLNVNYGFALTAGVNHLNGEEALMYARTRKVNTPDGSIADFGRTDRQRIVLNVLLETYKNAGMTKMLSLLDDILPMVTTDMSYDQMTGYVMDFYPMLADCTIVTQRIPADGAYKMTMIDGMSVLLPDLVANRELLIDSLLEE